MNLINVDLTADISKSLIFGLGVYILHYFYKDSNKSVEKSTVQNQSLSWNNANTIKEINSLILENNNINISPLDILDKIHTKKLNPNTETYNNLLNLCIVNNNQEDKNKLIEEIFDVMGPIQPDLTTYNIRFKGISYNINLDDKNKIIKESFDLLKELKNKELNPNLITLNTITDILIKCNEDEKALFFVENYEKQFGLKPDKYTYSILMKGKSKSFLINNFDRFWEHKYHDKEDIILFNSMINLCFKSDNHNKAEKLFFELNKFDIKPDIVTYILMVKGFDSIHNIKKSLFYFKLAKNDKNVDLNEILYTTILKSCVINENQKIFDILCEEINDKCFKNDEKLVTIMIKGNQKFKNSEKCNLLFSEYTDNTNISEQKISVYNSMLNACVELGEINKMKLIYEKIRENLLSNISAPAPDIITYTTIIKGYTILSESQTIYNLYKFLCDSQDIILDEIVFNCFLEAFYKLKEFQKANEIFNYMKEINMKLSEVSYTIMAKITVVNDFNLVYDLINEMDQRNINKGLIFYTTIIQAAIKSDLINKAIELFELVKKDKKIKIDRVCYNIIVSGCCYKSKWIESCQYLIEAFENNIRLTDDIYENLLRNLVSIYCNIKRELKLFYVEKILNFLESKNMFLRKEIYNLTANYISKTKWRIEEKNQGYRNNIKFF